MCLEEIMQKHDS